MVGFDPSEVHLSTSEHAFAGAVSGATTRAICQPLDVLKIRFQLQVEPLKRIEGSKYHGVLQAVRCIIREEGVQALWKGHVPAQLLSIFYGVAQYAAFEFLTQEIWIYLPEKLTTTYRPVTHTVCGGLGGCMATAFVQPLDVIRTRFVAQGEPKLYKNITSAVVSVMKQEGYKGFYRGLVPALGQIGPQMGLQFGFYAMFNGIWNRSVGALPSERPGSHQSFICGSTAGVIAKIIVHPLDVLKKRLQIQGFHEARESFGASPRYHGLWHCCYVSMKEEGPAAFYKGLKPSLMKAAAVAGINLCVYEQVCKALIHHKQRQL